MKQHRTGIGKDVTRRWTLVRKFAAMTALTFAVFSARADIVLFEDDFSGGAGDIHDTPPDIGINTWVATSGFQADGYVDNTGGEGAGTATLAFTPQNGNLYRLDASFSGITGGDNVYWMCFGFADGQGTSNLGAQNRFVLGETVGRAWTLFYTNGNGYAFLGSGTSGTAGGAVAWNNTPIGEGSDIDLRIVLDTTDGAGNWTATWYAKAPTDTSYVEVRGTADLLDEDITSVGYGKTGSSSGDEIWGTIERFSLSIVTNTSEPAITRVNSGAFNDTVDRISYTSSFAAGAADKLIVSAFTESAVEISGITYNGVAMTLIPETEGDRNCGTWYLDNPYTGGAADIVVSGNGVDTFAHMRLGIVSIAGSAGGYVAADRADATSVSLTIPKDESFVFAALGADGAATAPIADAPLTQVFGIDSDSAAAAAGYAAPVSSGSRTFSFTTGNSAPETTAVAFGLPPKGTLVLIK